MKNIAFVFIVFALVSSIFIPSINFAYADSPFVVLSDTTVFASTIVGPLNGGLIIETDGELIVDSGVTLTVNGSVTNNGKITIGDGIDPGVLLVNGGILNFGEILADGELLVNGFFVNFGIDSLVNVTICGKFVVTGSTTNNGEINFGLPSTSCTNEIPITDDITGLLTIDDGKIGVIAGNTTITISGTLVNNGEIKNRGHIILAAGGTIENGLGKITNFCLNFDDGDTLKGIDSTAGTIFPLGDIVNDPVDCVPPTADDDGYSTNEDEPGGLSVDAPGVLDGDTDDISLILTASFLSVVEGEGTIEMNDDGSFTYTPGLNFFGTFKFNYQAIDEDGGKGTGLVTIDVAQINDPPVANPDGITVNEDDGLVDITDIVLDNDKDIDPTSDILSIDDAEIDNDATGQVDVSSLFYSPNGQFESLGIGETATDTFDYTINDGRGGVSSPALVTVTINGQNDAPVADIDNYSMLEDGMIDTAADALVDGVLDNDKDIEEDGLTAFLDDDVENGVLVLDSDGNFTYKPNPNFFGSDSFTYHANDSLLDSNIATVTITVIDQDEPDLLPPTITLTSPITSEATSANTPVADVDFGVVTVTDDVDPAPIVSNDAPTSFPLGETEVTWTATDDEGRVSMETQFVTLVDTTSPSITPPPDVFKEIEGTETTLSTAELGTATATDAVDLDPEITNNAPALFPLGDTTVTWTAEDDEGNSASAEQLVTIEQAPDSLREEKNQIVDELEILLGDAEEKKTIKELKKAIKEIQKSLDDKSWKDDVTLDSKHGNKVFDHEKHAVKKLMKIEKDDDSTDVTGIIDSLVEIDRKLASDAFDKANTPENQEDKKAKKELEKSEKELVKGDEEAAKGKFDKAIDKYKKAWKHAQKAMKHNVDESEDTED